jgi:hypothetical protein
MHNNKQVAADLRRLADLIEHSPYSTRTMVHIHGMSETSRDDYAEFLSLPTVPRQLDGRYWHEGDMASERVEVVLHYTPEVRVKV